MRAGKAVTFVEGRIEIDDPDIEAGLTLLARRWRISSEDALFRALTIGIAQKESSRRRAG